MENTQHELGALAKALAAAQAEMQNPRFDRTNPNFRSKYASLAAVRDAVVPVLARHGIAVVQNLSAAEEGVTCETILIHEEGATLRSSITLPAQQFNAQGLGSAATYARRYALMAMAGVVGDDDDDGNAASASIAAATAAQPTPSPGLVAKAEIAAKRGVTSYQAFWKALTAYDKKALSVEHERLKTMAIDATPSEVE